MFHKLKITLHDNLMSLKKRNMLYNNTVPTVKNLLSDSRIITITHVYTLQGGSALRL